MPRPNYPYEVFKYERARGEGGLDGGSQNIEADREEGSARKKRLGKPEAASNKRKKSPREFN